MTRPTKYALILGFPSDISLPSGRVDRIQEIETTLHRECILDYQQLEITSSNLFNEGKTVWEQVEGYYKPKRLRFFDVQVIKSTGLYNNLDSLPPDHVSRSLHGALHWRPPNKSIPLYLLFNGGDEAGSCLFSAKKYSVEKCAEKITPISFIRDWSPAPPMPPSLVPQPKRLHKQFGGDSVTIHLGKRTYHKRLFVGGLDIQPEQRPDVNSVLNLGEECSRWAASSSNHPADRWQNKGEGSEGMNLDEIVAEAQWVIERLGQGEKVLVHCVAGFNRSVTICCAALMLMENLSAETALTRVRKHHPWALPDSHHWLALRWLAKKLKQKMLGEISLQPLYNIRKFSLYGKNEPEGIIMNQKMIGRFIVTDPDICHGKPTFRGTRIMVWQVLEQVANGMAWETIEEEWRGKVTKDAIAEAVRLASQAFIEHADEYSFGLSPA